MEDVSRVRRTAGGDRRIVRGRGIATATARVVIDGTPAVVAPPACTGMNSRVHDPQASRQRKGCSPSTGSANVRQPISRRRCFRSSVLSPDFPPGAQGQVVVGKYRPPAPQPPTEDDGDNSADGVKGRTTFSTSQVIPGFGTTGEDTNVVPHRVGDRGDKRKGCALSLRLLRGTLLQLPHRARAAPAAVGDPASE